MTRRLIIVLGGAGLLIIVLVLFNTVVKSYFIAQARAKNASPTQTVSTMTAEFSDWQPEITAVGTLRAYRGVDDTTEVAGLVRSINFKSGEDARTGAVLVELNADSDIAQLHALQAAADLAQTTYIRVMLQFDAQAGSQKTLDTDVADLKNRRAQAVVLV